MRASTNNQAATVLDLFLQATQIYGTPSRVRGDRGGENINLAIWMIMFRGSNRALFMWGSYVLLIISLVAALTLFTAQHITQRLSVCGLKSADTFVASGVAFLLD
jgi:hypothetical protein